MRDSQKLKPEFSEYLTILIKLFNQVIEQENIETLLQKQIKVSTKRFKLLQEGKRPKEDRLKGRYMCTLEMNKDNTADLYFQQVLEYVDINETRDSEKNFPAFKTLCLLQCHFDRADESKVKSVIKYRNKVAKSELESMQLRLKQVCGVIEDLNPSLVQQICKAV